MIVLNFSHPLLPDHLHQVETLTGEAVERVIDVPSQFAGDQPFAQQVRQIVDDVPLSPRDWQTLPLLVHPPSYNFGAVTLLAELEDRMGYLPTILRLRPVEGSVVRRIEVAEVIDLAKVRGEARKRR